jgi:tape measure domain-containing protein
MATNASLALIIGANASQFIGELKKAENEFKSFGSKLQSVGGTLTRSLTLPLVAIGTGAVASAAKMDSLKRGLTSVAGSVEEAEKQLTRLKEVAKLPGLGFEEAVQGSINLQAAGFSSEQAEKSLKAFGNALATVGKGKADLDGVILALGQIASKGKISAEEINQIAERVPQIRNVMKSAFGTADAQSLQKLGIDAQTFVAKVTDELNKLPTVTGGLQNSFENFGDSVKSSLAGLGDEVSKNLNIEGVLNSLSDKLQAVTNWFKNLSPETKKFVIVASSIAAAIGPLLTGFGFFTSKILPLMTSGLSSLSTGFTLLTSPVGLVVAAIAGAVILIIKYWDDIVAYFTTGDGAGVWNKLQVIVTGVLDAVKSFVSAWIDFFVELWSKIGDNVISYWRNMLKNITDILDNVLGIILDIVDFWKGVFTGNWEEVWNAVKRIWMRAFNILIDALEMFIGGTLEGLNMLAKIAGFDGFDETVASVHALADSFKFVIPETEKAAQSFEDFSARAAASADKATQSTKKVSEALAQASGRKVDPNSPTTPITPIAPQGSDGGFAIANGTDATAIVTANTQKDIEALNAEMERHKQQVEEVQAKYQQLGESIGQVFQSNTADVSNYLGELGKNVLRWVIQSIKAMAAAAIAGLISKSLQTFGPAGVVAAAAAPGIVGGLFDALIPKFAEGGIATGPTLGIFGEAGTEAIIPLDRLPSLMKNVAGPQDIRLETVITGQDIKLIYDRASRLNSKTL